MSDSARSPRPPAVLGVIGGGQLGRMFLQAAQRLGFDTVVLSPAADTPAAQVAHSVVLGLSDQMPKVREFAERASAVTVEFENVSAGAVRSFTGGLSVTARRRGRRCAPRSAGASRTGPSRRPLSTRPDGPTLDGRPDHPPG